ncbi:MAG: hypothetical protein GEU90_13995 [Gemmatimonas sp.]|nr:hypothetical protein [Gemmatimonas sp.]
MSRDERTYGKIRRQYDEWVESERTRPARNYLRREEPPSLHEQRKSTDMSRMVFAAIGVGIGIVLLGLAGIAFASASSWADFGREGAQVGYTLAGIFLTIAGLGGIAATLNHNFRVLTATPPEHRRR